jgi:glutamine amidotransferase
MRHALKVVVIDYGSGNLHSAKKAVVKAMLEAKLQGSVLVTNDPKQLVQATHIILPGVGAFADCMKGLQAVDGMIDELENQVLKNKKPFLGICVGMQMLSETGMEDGEHKGLGWLKGVVKKIPAKDGLRIPQMGWNSLKFNKESKLLNGISENDDVYFVHSYYFKTDVDNIVATTNYGSDITAIIEKDNIMGVQFHPEKSQKIGIKIISNFLLV